MNIQHQQEDIIYNRYSIIKQLGQGGSGITYAALDRETKIKVAIKALSLSGLNNWKKIELFGREAKILQQLNYPGIPKYLDYFKIDTEDDVYFYIVQQLAPGKSLVDLINEGWQPEEDTVKYIAQQILEILVYLQHLTPAVIHRDIKPQNIIYQPDTKQLFLVDFGAVQDTYQHTKMGSTIVGTYGYMAPEQYRGGAVLSTDLYSLGCTLLLLLTAKSPAELPQKKLKSDFRYNVNISRPFINWIDKLIEPNIHNRFPTAKDALVVLQGKESLSTYTNSAKIKPAYSAIELTHYRDCLTITIPPAITWQRHNKKLFLAIAWQLFVLFNIWALSSVFAHNNQQLVLFWSGLYFLYLILDNIWINKIKNMKNTLIFTQIILLAITLFNISLEFHSNIATNISFYSSLIIIFDIALSSQLDIFKERTPPSKDDIIISEYEIASNILAKSQIIRDLFCTTKVFITQNNIKVKRNIFNTWPKETERKISGKSIFYVEGLINFKSIETSKDLIYKADYCFGNFLSSKEKEWLQHEIVKQLTSRDNQHKSENEKKYQSFVFPDRFLESD